MIPNDLLAEGISIGHVMHPYIKDRLVKIREDFSRIMVTLREKLGLVKAPLL